MALMRGQNWRWWALPAPAGLLTDEWGLTNLMRRSPVPVRLAKSGVAGNPNARLQHWRSNLATLPAPANRRPSSQTPRGQARGDERFGAPPPHGADFRVCRLAGFRSRWRFGHRQRPALSHALKPRFPSSPLSFRNRCAGGANRDPVEHSVGVSV